MTPVIDIIWPLVSPGRVPTQHHYQLLACLSRVVPGVHQNRDLGVHSIRGRAAGPGLLELHRGSSVGIRVRADWVPALLPLSGRQFDLGGHAVRLGVPRLHALAPADCLRAWQVTIKGFVDGPQFDAAVRRQLDTLGVRTSVLVGVGPRRVVRVRGQTIVGFGVELSGLTTAESLRVQEAGVGGRRHFGCGLFLSVAEET